MTDLINTSLERVRSVDYKAVMTKGKDVCQDFFQEIKTRGYKTVERTDNRAANIINLSVVLFSIFIAFVAPPFVAFIGAYYLTKQNNKDFKHSLYIIASTVVVDVVLCWFFWIPAVVYSLVILLQVTQYVPFWESTERFGTKLFTDEKEE
jgi:uncharacterized membrane protein YqaE (UPF0057 family)